MKQYSVDYCVGYMQNADWSINILHSKGSKNLICNPEVCSFIVFRTLGIWNTYYSVCIAVLQSITAQFKLLQEEKTLKM